GSMELGDLLTDGDGNPATGPEPTVVVVGDAQVLAISKRVAVVGGGAVEPGAELEYVVRVLNIGSVPAVDVVVTDDLAAPVPGHLLYVAQSATLNGSSQGVSVAGSVLSADYAAVVGDLQPGAEIVLRFRARIAADLSVGTTVTNIGRVAWNSPTQTAEASVSVDVGGTPGMGALNGRAWHDADFDAIFGANERALEGWSVELYRNGRLLHTATTGADGGYRIAGLGPNEAGTEQYQLRFRAPGAGAATAPLGVADSPFTDGLQRISDIVVPPGSNLQGLNLPIAPNGVVYDSMLRTPVAGATLTLLRAGSGAALPAGCFDDAAQQNQVTLGGGHYRFDLNFSDPACPSGAGYRIDVTAPSGDYLAGQSQVIPPFSDATTAPFPVPGCAGGVNDAVPATGEHCEAQVSEFAPASSVRARSAGTTYHLHLTLDGSRIPGTSQIFNNHIPLDSELQGALAITKTTPRLNVSRGDMVPYAITVNNVIGLELRDLAIIDRFPAGFRYVEGSARLDGQPAEPLMNGRELIWNDLEFSATGSHTIVLLLAVGAGVSEGEFVNRAQVINGFTGQGASGEALASVRVIPDPTFDCTDVTGKVFDDANLNGVQDEGERGLPGVRLITARGLAAITDEHGRFHITCAATPREGRGSNFILKLDDRSLPSGYRVTTENPPVQRVTRGKAARFNFGATIHRVVSLDIADAVFEPGTTQMRRQWQPRVDLLLTELRKAPAVLRLAYLADVEDARLVEQRMQVVQRQITDAWKALDCCYQLIVEPQIFWRLGGAPADNKLRMATGK
ncbi:MAG: hypothetical protein ACNA7W_14130, partial [Pseudomonadales bacterium]